MSFAYNILTGKFDILKRVVAKLWARKDSLIFYFKEFCEKN